MANESNPTTSTGPTLFLRASDVFVIAVTAGIAFALLGYWPSSHDVPAGVFYTQDELYVLEWLKQAIEGHVIGLTLPYGMLFHSCMAVWFFCVSHVLRVQALSAETFTTWLRAGDAILWVIFSMYLCAHVSRGRRFWVLLVAANPVVLYFAFGYAKPDFLMFALASLAALHAVRWRAGERDRDLWAAALFLGAATATKPSALIIAMPWYLLIVATVVWRTSGGSRGALATKTLAAAMIVMVVSLLLSPQFVRIGTTLASLISESRLVRTGFPGTLVYPSWYWLGVLLLSFPAEVAFFVAETFRGDDVDRATGLACGVIFLVIAISVKRFMPAYLLPLMAIVVGSRLGADLALKSTSAWRLRASMAAALLFSAVCLYPKILANHDFAGTSYGQAQSFAAAHQIEATALSETALTSSGLNTVAHFWTPPVQRDIEQLFRTRPAGYYVLSDDSLIKTTVTGLALGALGQQYRRNVTAFAHDNDDGSVFSVRYEREAQERFVEIHQGAYWPWRYVVALALGQRIANGTSVTLYRF